MFIDDFIDDLFDVQKDAIARQLIFQRFKKDQVIVHQGDNAYSFFIIKSVISKNLENLTIFLREKLKFPVATARKCSRRGTSSVTKH